MAQSQFTLSGTDKAKAVIGAMLACRLIERAPVENERYTGTVSFEIENVGDGILKVRFVKPKKKISTPPGNSFFDDLFK